MTTALRSRVVSTLLLGALLACMHGARASEAHAWDWFRAENGNVREGNERLRATTRWSAALVRARGARASVEPGRTSTAARVAAQDRHMRRAGVPARDGPPAPRRSRRRVLRSPGVLPPGRRLLRRRRARTPSRRVGVPGGPLRCRAHLRARRRGAAPAGAPPRRRIIGRRSDCFGSGRRLPLAAHVPETATRGTSNNAAAPARRGGGAAPRGRAAPRRAEQQQQRDQQQAQNVRMRLQDCPQGDQQQQDRQPQQPSKATSNGTKQQGDQQQGPAGAERSEPATGSATARSATATAARRAGGDQAGSASGARNHHAATGPATWRACSTRCRTAKTTRALPRPRSRPPREPRPGQDW